MSYIKGESYIQDTEKYGERSMYCFETTETYAFFAPIVGDKAIDLTQVDVYSNKEGDTPIESIANIK